MMQNGCNSSPSWIRRSLIASTLLLAWTASGVAAQSSRRWTLQGSGLYVGVGGDAFDGLKSGPGGELQLRFTPGRLSVGVGGQYSTHQFDFEGLGDRSVSFAGVFVEPRLVFDVGKDSYAPYLAARLAYLQQAFTLTGADLGSPTSPDIDLTATGSQINGGGGVLFRLTPRVNLDLGATIGFIRFGDVEAKQGTLTVPIDGTSGNGQNLVFRVGLAIGLGK